MIYGTRLYGPGIAAEGIETALRLEGSVGHIDAFDLEVPFDRTKLRTIGFSHQGLEIGWENDAGSWALQVLDPEQSKGLFNQLREYAPASVSELARQTRRRSRYVWIGLSFVAFAVLLVVAALGALFAGLDTLAAWAATHVSVEQERQLGEQALKSMVALSALRDDSESARVTRSIGRKITAGSRYQYQFHVVHNAEVNAFALPGGIIVVNTGLVAATERPEELAGVLAHEVQHVELQHGVRQIVKQLGVSACVSIIAGYLASGLGAEVAEQLVNLKFSRGSEQQADAHAVESLVKAEIDPLGLPQFFAKLQNRPAPPNWLSSHPSAADRQQRLEALIREHSGLRSAPLMLGPWPPPSGE